MREMKDSGIEWIGNVPSNWKLSKIKYMTTQRECVGKYTPEKDKFIGLENVIGFADRYIETSTEYETSIYDVCHKGDILFGRLRPYLAKILTVPFDGYCTGEFLVFDSFNGCKNYLKYVLLSKPFIDEVNLSTYGAKMPRANADFILNMYLPLPQIVEQEKIAGFLDSQCSQIDAISADIQKEIETLEQYKRSVITEAVTKGLNPDVEMKDSGIEWVGNIPAHWDTIPIRYLFAECRLKNILNQEKTALKFTYGTIIKKTNFDSDSDEYVANTMTNYTVVYPGTIMINGLNLNYDFVSQRVGLVKDRGAITSAYLAIVPGSRVVSEYANYQLKSWDYAKAFHNMGTGVRKTLDFSELGKKYFVTPSIEEQSKIVAFLDSKCKEIEAIIASKKQQLTVIDSYKKSLIYEYVTGKKEVPAQN